MPFATAIVTSRAPLLAFLAMGMGWGGFAVYVPAFRDRLGVGDGVFGLLLLGSSLGLVTAMWLAPRVDRRLGAAALPVASAMLSLAFLAPASAPAPLLFALGMVATGLASGLTDVVMNARVADLEARHRRSLMNVNHGMFSVGYVISALLAGAAREAGHPPQVYFALLALLTLTLALGAASPGEAVETGGEAPRATPFGLIAAAGGIVLTAFMIENAIEAWSALHIERTLGGRASEGALGAASLGLTMAIGRFAGRFVAERLPDRAVLLWASGLTTAGLFTAGLAPVPVVAYLGFGMTGLGVSVIAPIALGLAGRAAPPADRTRVIARVAVIGFLGFFLSPLVMGGLSEAFSLPAALCVMAIMPLAVPLLLRRIG
jgi:MFS family permease